MSQWYLFGSCPERSLDDADRLDLICLDAPGTGFPLTLQDRRTIEHIAIKFNKPIGVFLHACEEAPNAKLCFIPDRLWHHDTYIDADGLPYGHVGSVEPVIQEVTDGWWIHTDTYCGKRFFAHAEPIDLQHFSRALSINDILVAR